MTTMKLSEAIRLGAMNSPQGTGCVFRDGRTCALGAALEAIGERLDNGWVAVYDHWPISRLHVLYPGESHRGETILVGSCCWILNDADHWTREQIADWVAAVEAQHEARQEVAAGVPQARRE